MRLKKNKKPSFAPQKQKLSLKKMKMDNNNSHILLLGQSN